MMLLMAVLRHVVVLCRVKMRVDVLLLIFLSSIGQPQSMLDVCRKLGNASTCNMFIVFVVRVVPVTQIAVSDNEHILFTTVKT